MQLTIKRIVLCCGFCLGLFSILSAQSGILDNIKDQNIAPTESFETINIADFILPGVNCATVELTAMRKQGTDTKPTTVCEKTEAYHSTMNAFMQLTYGPGSVFDHSEDYLVLYNDKDEIVECGTPSDLVEEDILLKESVYGLNIKGGSARYPVRMVFYSGADQQLYEQDSIFEFLQNTKMGKIGTPYTLDLAPITMAASLENSMLVTPVIQDQDFIGQICYQIKVTDCDNGETGMDEVCFSIGIDSDCEETHLIDTELFTNLTYKAVTTIEANNVIQATAEVTYQAGESIRLKPGFEVKAGAIFVAKIADCIPVAEAGILPPNLANWKQLENGIEKSSSTEQALISLKQVQLKIAPNPVVDWVNLQYYLPTMESTTLRIIDVQGTLLQQIKLPATAIGWQNKVVNTTNLPSGIYFVSLESNQQLIHQKMLIR